MKFKLHNGAFKWPHPSHTTTGCSNDKINIAWPLYLHSTHISWLYQNCKRYEGLIRHAHVSGHHIRSRGSAKRFCCHDPLGPQLQMKDNTKMNINTKRKLCIFHSFFMCHRCEYWIQSATKLGGNTLTSTVAIILVDCTIWLDDLNGSRKPPRRIRGSCASGITYKTTYHADHFLANLLLSLRHFSGQRYPLFFRCRQVHTFSAMDSVVK